MAHATYTADEIAQYLRVHPYTVKRLARAGKIPGFKIGDQWRFDVQEIEDWKKTQGTEDKSTTIARKGRKK
ncbi:MAG: helix-turn-helix domain-containing protein [Candidatus Omnitrophota bacterium]|jgi:excisionase family DNA binding protein